MATAFSFDDLDDNDTDEYASAPDTSGADPEGKKDTKKDDIHIPKSRYDEEMAKMKAKYEALEAQVKTQPAAQREDPSVKWRTELEDLEDKYEEALLDGDKATAKQLRTQRRQLQNKLEAYQAQATTNTATSASQEAATFNATVSQYEAKYPQLDSNSPTYDQTLTEDVLTMMAGYISNGKSRAEALKLSVKRLVPDAPAQNANQRGTEARRKALIAQNRQPPSSPGLGGVPTADEFDVDVAGLSRADIAKMDAKKLSILRGDYLG